MAREHVEIQLLTTVDAGELLGLLEETDCLGACEQDGGLSLYWAKERWHAETARALTEALRLLGVAQAAETFTVRELPDQDWNAHWAASLQPIYLGLRVLVRQSWNTAAVPVGGFELILDPKRAFGTGYHATTQLIVAWLEDVIHGGESVLDVGTGSGILAMVALRLGARSALGIDNDPEAIECAQEYAAVNGFGAEMQLRVAALEELSRQQFDLLLANLDRKTLLRYFPAFHSFLRSGGELLVSGLQREDDQEICAALVETGWDVRDRRESDEWLALRLVPKGQGMGNK
jgi:ribosomal protein L11 methyltransferase